MPLRGVCKYVAVRAVFGLINSSPFLSELQRGYGLFSPRQSRSPPVVYSLVQIPEIFNMHSGGDGAEIHFQLSASVSPSEPHFLHAAEYGNYVYFFYREIAVEQSNLGKVRW